MSKSNKSKIYKNEGSVMVLAVIVIAITMITISTIAFQNINQIKSTTNNQNNQSYKYAAESGIDKIIAEACRQVEQVDATTTNLRKESRDDKYFYVKGKLEEILVDLDKVNSGTSNLKTEIKRVLNKTYVEDNILIDDLVLLKQKSIETSGEIGYENEELRNRMYNIINKINEILELGFYYEHINHSPFEFKPSKQDKNWNIAAIETNFKDSNSSTKPNYNISRIADEEVLYAKTESENARNKIPNSTHSNVSNYVMHGIINEVGYISTRYLKGGEGLVQGLSSVRNEFQYLINVLHNGKTPLDSEFTNKKNQICKAIDAVIVKINSAQIELYKLYTEKRDSNPNAYKPEPYIDIIQRFRPEVLKSIKYLDIAKKNLVETKCKLGDKYIPPTTEEGNKTEYKIIIEEETYELNENIKYTIKGVNEEIPVMYNKENTKIVGIDDIDLIITSIGSGKLNTEYKIESKIKIKSELKNNKFITSYDVISHEMAK